MSDSSIVIYEPPTRGWPYVVLVRQGDEYDVVTAKTRKEAREIALAKRVAAKAKQGSPSPDTQGRS